VQNLTVWASGNRRLMTLADRVARAAPAARKRKLSTPTPTGTNASQ
jgi:hypothetical protein